MSDRKIEPILWFITGIVLIVSTAAVLIYEQDTQRLEIRTKQEIR